MEKATERFGDFIKRIRTSFTPKMTLKQLSEKLRIPLTQLSDIENNRKKPFDKDKIDLFASIFGLSENDKALAFDLAGRERNEIPQDISEKMMYSEVGDLARKALRISNGKKQDVELWKEFIQKIEETLQK